MGELQKKRLTRHQEQRKARTAEALEERLKGRTYQEIGDVLGVTGETARLWVKAALKEAGAQTLDLANELRELEHQRFQRLLTKAETSMEAIDQALETHVTLWSAVAHRAMEKGELPPPYEPDPNLLRERRQLMETILKISDRIRDLYGLDAPLEVNVNTHATPTFGDATRGGDLKEKFIKMQEQLRQSQKGAKS